MMAEEAFKRLEEQLNCPICLETYTDPKQLQCNHIFCRKCLVPLGIRDQQGQLTLTCPECRAITPIPARGVAGLQSAFHINRFLEVQEAFKKVKLSSQPTTEGVEGKPQCDSDQTTVIRHCLEHADKELELYCETCAKLICYKCAVRGGKHYSHQYTSLDVAFEAYKQEILASLQPMETQLLTVNRALAELDACHMEIANQQAALKVDIHDKFRRLHEILEVRRTELISHTCQKFNKVGRVGMVAPATLLPFLACI